MKTATRRQSVCWLVLAALLLPTATALAALQPAATLTLQYHPSARKWIPEGAPLFGRYLGTGDGVATGALAGTVGWDLYEDQSRADRHPALFRGFVERAGTRHAFQLIGVFTPEGRARAVMPDGRTHLRHWTLSGTIVFEDTTLLGVRHAPVTGAVDLGVGTGRYTIWVEPDGAR